MKNFLIVIAGPTASGKTSLAIELAKRYNTSILSCDSRQFYRELSIGTAKPTSEELAEAKHYFIDSLSIHNEYSVGDYETSAVSLLEELYASKQNPVILTGGSGLYIKAALEGFDTFPEVTETIKDKYIELEKNEGILMLQKELREKDPEYYNQVDTNNPHRLIRALSVIEASGNPFSFYRKQGKKERNFEPIIINLEWERKELYERINKRVDMMMEAGQLAEAKSLHHLKHLNALQTVGYQELFEYFDGNISLPEAIELIKRNTRRYAKRQMTWFRKMENTTTFHPSQLEEIIEYINSRIN